MSKVVVISHASDFVRKGLSSVLEKELNINIVENSDCSEIEKKYLKNYLEVAVLLPIECNDQELFIKLRSKGTRILIVGVITGMLFEPENELFDFTISVLDSPNYLIGQLNTFFSKEENTKELDELTIREREVLRLIALGHTNKSIADTLFISTHTVISHRKNITDKLGIKSIPGLTVYAIIQKIISQSDIAKDKLL